MSVIEERIMTLHPDGKAGVNILKRRYDVISDYITGTLAKNGSMEFRELTERAHTDLKNKFDGKITWYLVTVKLDLEARGKIRRLPGSGPQKLVIK